MRFEEMKQALVEAAKRAGLTEYEIFYQADESISAETLKDEISSFSSGVSGGVCFRCIVNGKMGCLEKEVALRVNGKEVSAIASAWQATYTINDSEVTIVLNCQNGVYHLPIVCPKSRCATLSEDGRVLKIDHALTVKSDVPLAVDCQKRVFHQVGGLLYLPIAVSVEGRVTLSITVPPVDRS